tara:strand:- start:393 stop:713 length:321 start_codon:yes stop_codon:yes gene_type:complete
MLTFTAQASCPKYQFMKKDDLAPCNGLFLNERTNDAVKKDLRDYSLTKKQLELKDLQLSSIKKDRDKWAQEAMKQAKARHNQRNDLRNGFLVGIALTLAILFSAGR